MARVTLAMFLGLDPYYCAMAKLQGVGQLSHPSHLSTNGGVPGFLKNGMTHGDPKIHGKTLVMFHGETHIGFGVPILSNHQIEGSKINLWQKVLDKVKRGDKPNYAHLHEICFTPLKTKTCFCPIRNDMFESHCSCQPNSCSRFSFICLYQQN
jgi:hypothetical protein